ncbi:MAG TPA: dicarboxylate/amino acid:cation symporter [Caulobacteraceae bacterium]
MRFLKHLYVQVLIAIALGIAVGALWPQAGVALKPLGDAFVRLIKMIIAPVIFCTVTAGIAHMSDLRKFGRVGGKALVYFEAVSTLALLIGVVVALVVRPGAGFDIDPSTLDPKIAAGYARQAGDMGLTEHLLEIIPDTFVSAFTGGNLLQVLLVAILTGFALTRLGEFGHRVTGGIDAASQVFFAVIRIVVRAAPVGAFGAMAFTIGKYGLGALVQLGALIGTFYLTSALFVLLGLGAIAALAGFSILKFLAYIKEELLIVLGASSSEAVLPQMMDKLERLGASRPVVGLVIPTGYSFNLDGTNIYMTLATLFLAQATNTHLGWGQIATLLLVAMITSKGASGVTGAGFITLAATLAVVPAIPIQALAILVGVDRFMSECRALTNVIGNGVATLVVARWEGELDGERMAAELNAGRRGAPAGPALAGAEPD